MVTWQEKGCNNNGGVSKSVSSKVSFGSKITQKVGLEISSTIETDAIFTKASFTAKASYSLARQWDESRYLC